MSVRVRVYIDFDGTIARNDVGNEFYQKYGAFEPSHTELTSGQISVSEFYRRACAQLPATLTDADVAAFTATEEVDSGFASLVDWCRAHDIPISVVSDGYVNYITPILQRLNISDVEVFANVLEGTPLRPSFPNASESCTCYCASCKRNVVITHSAPEDVLVYIGDGLSDTCVASHCDVIFAKTELAAFCTAQRIPHHPWRHLSDVQRILEQHRLSGGFRQRHQAVLARTRAVEEE